jgi:hypothetical protein
LTLLVFDPIEISLKIFSISLTVLLDSVGIAFFNASAADANLKTVAALNQEKDTLAG